MQKMKKNRITFRTTLLQLIIISIFYSCSERKIGENDYCKYVDPFIGTAYHGHTFPGACRPFGFIQASPQTGNDSWRYCSGYNIEDDSIMGFAQNFLNGTGCSDLGDILILPFSGEFKGDNYKAKYDTKKQIAVPGFYSTELTDYNIGVKLTATQRTAFHQYTYNGDGSVNILLDMQNGVVWSPEALRTHILQANMKMPDNYTITGHQEVKNWVQRHYFYAIKFDKPYSVKEELPANEGEIAKRLILNFDLQDNKDLKIKIAISTVSVEGALASLEAESSGWDFETIKSEAYNEWNTLLSKAKVEGTEEQKKSYYTSLYHLFVQPTNIADVDGRYRGANDSVYVSPTGNYYSTFSLWDTYRAAHPLYTIITPEKIDDLVQSMLLHSDTHGYLPIWTLWGKENHCMIGNHAVPVIVDAYMKGFRNFDIDKAYKAIKTSLTVNHEKSDWNIYDKYGYYPFDLIPEESVSRTLESAYDDYCAALMAKELGKNADYEFFMKRSGFYKNMFDKDTGLMRGKDSKGKWRTPFNPFHLSHATTTGGDFIEANSWQYTWHVQHDVDGLIDLMGGATLFEQKLDSLFTIEATQEQTGFVSDVTGLIGQYAHGNEPSHHVAYLYNYVGKPSKTQTLIREICDQFYQPKPDGLCGNDDCGQMSAWYVFSAMGFYPVNPVGGEYIIGAPQLDRVELEVNDGKLFVMEAKNLSKENKYVQSVTLNGKIVNDYKIHHEDIMKGGNLVFEMGNTPLDLR